MNVPSFLSKADYISSIEQIGSPKNSNYLIHGSNIPILKDLKKKLNSKVKLVYIDPPYNTGNNFDHYDDNETHDKWQLELEKTLSLLHSMLTDDGSIWISIDDTHVHSLRQISDKIFNQKNYITSIIWQKKLSPSNDNKYISTTHEYILVYSKNKELWRPNLLPRTIETNNRYKNPDNDPRGNWTSSDLTVKTVSKNYLYPITSPSGKVHYPSKGRSWGLPETTLKKLINDNYIWFGKSGNTMPRYKRFLTEVQNGIVPKSLWLQKEVGDNQEAKKEILDLHETVFATPKPERLLQRIIHIASQPSDIILDCYAGTGTTGAVAHKMNRKWIMIEHNGVCKSHCIPRLLKVIKGTDAGSVNAITHWKGGGGFSFIETKLTNINGR